MFLNLRRKLESYLEKNRIVLLAADTSRSRAYAQALEQEGLVVGAALLLAPPGRNAGPFPDDQEGVWADSPVTLPKLSIPLQETCEKVAGRVVRLETGDVNDPGVDDALVEMQPDLVIYSGFGGQIVGDRLLSHPWPFLHVHAGYLPDFRGSTTIYYSLLAGRECGVSAILLSSRIDEGDIVARRAYPAPPAGLDIDHLYDGAIRADLLKRTLRDWLASRDFGFRMRQTAGEGGEYYIIHPVLKHLALLSLSSRAVGV